MNNYLVFLVKMTLLVGGFMPFVSVDADPTNPKELGKIRWNRSFSKAQEEAKKEQKPLFLLFQEVPG